MIDRSDSRELARQIISKCFGETELEEVLVQFIDAERLSYYPVITQKPIQLTLEEFMDLWQQSVPVLKDTEQENLCSTILDNMLKQLRARGVDTSRYTVLWSKLPEDET